MEIKSKIEIYIDIKNRLEVDTSVGVHTNIPRNSMMGMLTFGVQTTFFQLVGLSQRMREH